MNRLLIGLEIIKLQSIDSTNNYAAKLLNEGVLSDGSVIMAQEQHNGRGQMGTTWHADTGQNLTCSVVLKSTNISLNHQFDMSMIVALAVYDALESLGMSPTIKWPNDILVADKKISGVLIENTLKGGIIKHFIVGLGLNVNQEMDIDDRTSIYDELQTQHEVADVLDVFLNMFEMRWFQYRNKGFDSTKNDYMLRLMGVENAQIQLTKDQSIITGKVIDIQRSGKLQFVSGDANYSFDLKEIKFIL